MSASIDLPNGWRLETCSEIDSTNAEILRRAERGEPEGLALRADHQTAGRGRRGRRWESPQGNLYLSALVDAPPDIAGQVGFAAALALVDGLEAEADQPLNDLRVKWPNDLLLGASKMAGLLLEGVPGRNQVVVGMGANLISTSVKDAIYKVGSLSDVGLSFDPNRLSAQVCNALNSWLGTWRTVGFGPLRKAWLKRAYGVNDPIVVRLPNDNLEGRFVGLAPDGALLLEQATGERIIPAGDVFFAPQGGA